jgi:HSP20 family protein
MAIVRFDPFRGFEKMTRKMSDIMSDLEKGVNFEVGAFLPRVDITEGDANIFVHAELPGIPKENVKVSVNEERMLTIKGEKTADESMKDRTMVRTERTYGQFTRNFILPEYIDINSISAKFENGVLELKLNKIEPPKPKSFDVEIG